ncbi:uncharacterized protein N7496_002484 [Penicillium cataractarum]|uniref:Major facilitator superfamily (MFS) profile domain-containing protein n=1 Tax=Penicillium cataractarum TaxID=2100454 RepID=A0A9W9SK53_9EURO|nr:uncharacterized protein N7496_002484 [Penicillium cataractarum]KAJ5380056.1 hypothetical protein N7496_002484 [Penicillium cataractarum]
MNDVEIESVGSIERNRSLGDNELKAKHVSTLGSVRLRHPTTNDLILVPTPSNDPNDPLNWSRGFRVYIAIISCAAIFMAQFLAAGPSADMAGIVHDLFGVLPTNPGWSAALAKASYLFSGTAFVQGMSNLFYMPLIIKYGRRPVYIFSFLLYGGCSLWAGLATDYPSALAARLILGFAGGSAECVAPLTIADTFFLHERGLVMSFYSAALSCGIAGGIILSGLITIHQSWRVIYFLASGIIWLLVLVVFFTMPETAYQRNLPMVSDDTELGTKSRDIESSHIEFRVPPKKTYIEQLRIFNPKYTTESLFTLFWRPVPLLIIPSVLFGTLSMSVCIGSFVAISSNYATAFTELYGFSTWECGLSYVAVLIGALIGIFGGGWLSDNIADLLTQRKSGVREPEMRLPTITISLILAPLALMLYGSGIQYSLHWMVPILGLGLLGFVITQVSNIVLVYAVDAYRPIAGEVIVSQLSFKAAFGFLLSFYTNPWIDSTGYMNSFGTLAGICAAVLIMWIPLYFWGIEIRAWILRSRIGKGIRWGEDREVGE